MPSFRTLSVDILQALTAENSSGTSEFTRDTKTAKAIEVWVLVTAISGDFTFNIETAIEENGESGTFQTEETIANITTTGAFPVTINRADNSLGRQLQTSWVANSGTATFEIKMGRFE